MAESLAIETIGLHKSYESFEALRGLALQVPRGSICGFLGRNGAGKTTTLKILLGMTKATSGTASVLGLTADDERQSLEIRSRTGFVSEEKDLYGYMSVGEIIGFTAAFFPHWRKDLEQRYLRQFELPQDRGVKALSRGMRTKLALLLALCRGAELLILDEPTSALDPASAEEVLQALVGHVAGEAMTVFFSSHQIAEVEQIADRVVIVNRGRAVIEGSLDDLREHYCRVQIAFDTDAPAVAFNAPGVQRVARQGRVISVLSSNGSEEIVDQASALSPRSIDVVPVSLKEMFLESVAEEE